jgi:hypothetical protein
MDLTQHPSQILSQYLYHLPSHEQFHFLSSFLLNVSGQASNLCHVIKSAWDYLSSNPNLWASKYPSIFQLEEEFNYYGAIEQLIEYSNKTSKRVTDSLKIFERNWNVIYPDVFRHHDPSIAVPFLPSLHFAAKLTKLSKETTPQLALRLLYDQIQVRLRNPSARVTTVLQVDDIVQVIKSLESPTPTLDLPPYLLPSTTGNSVISTSPIRKFSTSKIPSNLPTSTTELPPLTSSLSSELSPSPSPSLIFTPSSLCSLPPYLKSPSPPLSSSCNSVSESYYSGSSPSTPTPPPSASSSLSLASESHLTSPSISPTSPSLSPSLPPPLKQCKCRSNLGQVLLPIQGLPILDRITHYPAYYNTISKLCWDCLRK